jgi:Redoxin
MIAKMATRRALLANPCAAPPVGIAHDAPVRGVLGSPLPTLRSRLPQPQMSETPSSQPTPPLTEAIAAARARLAPYWIHSPPLFVVTTAGDEPSQLCFIEPALADRVILLAFWQTTSLPARAQAPAIARWQAAYAPSGFLTVGIHTPEFEFARERAHVAAAAAALGIRYPIALDQDGAIARALAVERWPHLVLLDRDGEVVFERAASGPGASATEEGAEAEAEAEAAIRAALLTGRPGLALPPAMAAAPPAEAPSGASRGRPAPDVTTMRAAAPLSPDLACGFLRGRSGNRESRLDATGGVVECAAETRRASDVPYLAGRWRATRESWVAVPAPGHPSRLLLRCRAGEVHAILGPHDTEPASVAILLAGRPLPPALYGRDVVLAPDSTDPAAGEVSRTRPVAAPGLLHLVTSPSGSGPLDLELVVAERPVAIYGFRFAHPHAPQPGRG